MTKSLSIISIENTIDRLELPAFHPRAYPINERRIRYYNALRVLLHLCDSSGLDEYLHSQLHNRLFHAYVNGGL